MLFHKSQRTNNKKWKSDKKKYHNDFVTEHWYDLKSRNEKNFVHKVS